ncbi:ALF repeat-containing protein [Streptomyces sp. NPDC003952]
MASVGGPEVRKAAGAALRGTPEDRIEFLKTGQHVAREKDKAAEEAAGKPDGGTGDGGGDEDGGTTTPVVDHGANGGTGTGTGTDTGNQPTPAGGTPGSLARTGAGAENGWIAGGAATALAAGAGLVLVNRRRRTASGR